MTENTREITSGKRNEHREAARERLEKAKAGESGETIEQVGCHVLHFEEYGDIEWLT